MAKPAATVDNDKGKIKQILKQLDDRPVEGIVKKQISHALYKEMTTKPCSITNEELESIRQQYPDYFTASGEVKHVSTEIVMDLVIAMRQELYEPSDT